MIHHRIVNNYINEKPDDICIFFLYLKLQNEYIDQVEVEEEIFTR
jgi:hypothetical protein